MAIGTCDNCERQNVAVSHRDSGTECYVCQGDVPDPYGELEEMAAGQILNSLFSDVSSLSEIKESINVNDVADLELVHAKLSRVIDYLRGNHAS